MIGVVCCILSFVLLMIVGVDNPKKQEPESEDMPETKIPLITRIVRGIAVALFMIGVWLATL